MTKHPIARSGVAPDIGVVNHPRSSRQRYRGFVEDYKHRRLDDSIASGTTSQNGQAPDAAAIERRGKRRQYVREYLRWLRPYRYAVVGLFLLALLTAGLQMIEPLFMRFIIDHVLLDRDLDAAARLTRLNLAGGLFVVVIVLSNLVNLTKDYRQRLLNVKVMLSLRRAMFERLLHLPLPKLWDMKTGGILSRLTGDVDTTTGLMQMALVSPAISVIRLVIAIGVLMALNWRL
ncbi:MAG TPA: ABC transporter ATP-binding protein, partial [Gemmatimonadaceae bacterium]